MCRSSSLSPSKKTEDGGEQVFLCLRGCLSFFLVSRGRKKRQSQRPVARGGVAVIFLIVFCRPSFDSSLPRPTRTDMSCGLSCFVSGGWRRACFPHLSVLSLFPQSNPRLRRFFFLSFCLQSIPDLMAVTIEQRPSNNSKLSSLSSSRLFLMMLLY